MNGVKIVINEIEFTVLEIVNRTILNKQINSEQLNDEFAKMGIDSMEIIRFIVAVEEHYNIEFEDELLEMNNISTIHKISLLVYNEIKRRDDEKNI